MKEELIQFHVQEMERALSGLDGWKKPADGYVDEKCRVEHISTFEKMVSLHARALDWLKSL